jgi:hypothetical protein
MNAFNRCIIPTIPLFYYHFVGNQIKTISQDQNLFFLFRQKEPKTSPAAGICPAIGLRLICHKSDWCGRQTHFYDLSG